VITPYVGRILLEHWVETRDRDARYILDFLSAGRQSRTLAGVVYENFMHQTLCNGGDRQFTLSYLEPRWAGNEKYYFETKVGAKTESITFPKRKQTLFDTKKTFLNLEASCYYKPCAANHATFDAFVMDSIGLSTDKRLILLQSTINRRHDINSKGLKALEAQLPPKTHASDSKPWDIIFVTSELQDFTGWTDTVTWGRKLRAWIMRVDFLNKPGK
jgi:hypothetical protein